MKKLMISTAVTSLLLCGALIVNFNFQHDKGKDIAAGGGELEPRVLSTRSIIA
ncbi:hypothetical protein [Heyndrickxia oleronia]|jgi:hypothetical protein|uniref:hypothetical protein n=1 Tax=Heyndrickxia oleronia TaxID=38875 RepID=UPI000A42F56C|nr:hypothetical protein [Heyndrickxia oleronia]MCI1589845.1 hypothetical protein [Heyndrickxia oleronia]MCI1613447.1 hypothetical protein [Heyndrickxia oleronia]MCI1744438.1 hypothetical protein [Heyndrickxia oleronia]MCI1763769.1 hypothetical protein [Heyndrickxia oleronia]MCM3240510.1 hypothetical protein [Heyndrickxia oleronia]